MPTTTSNAPLTTPTAVQPTTSLLSISPTGQLHLTESLTKETNQPIIQDKKIIAAFKSSTPEGLLALARASNTQAWPAALHYWRHFTVNYLNRLCQQTGTEDISPIPPPTPEAFQDTLLQLPPMPGSEYATSAMLHALWLNFDAWIQHHIAAIEGGLPAFLEKTLPEWHQVGHVCFHLAENKQDEDYPFAFIATYAPLIGKNARIQYQPLSHALQTYAGEGNKSQLIKLLKPVYEASKHCPWLEALLESRDIYHPLAWTPEEAHTLLKSVPELEASGLKVRLPNWWKKRPRPKVAISIGHAEQKALRMETMLDFNVSIALDGTPLTPEELAAMQSATDGLIALRGQWVEVDPEQLQEALNHWENVQDHINEGGLSFIEGMRLLAGTDTALAHNDASTQGSENWAYVDAGGWLGDLLTQLRSPEAIAAQHPGKQLKATLRPYQHIGVNWLHFLTELGLGACLADDMGLGKTLQVIALLLIKKQQSMDNPRPTLLVLPASLLSNWKTELTRFAPTLRARYLHASEMSKALLSDIQSNPSLLNNDDIVLTTYGMLLRQPWLQEQSWRLVILDEAQAIKNPGTRQTKAVKQLTGQARIALTGTPIENRLGDLWSLFDFLCPGLLGTAPHFRDYIKQIDKEDSHSFTPLRKLVQPYILRRLKTDKKVINDLPDKTELVAWCGLSKAQASLYLQAVKELQAAIDNASGIKRRGLVLSYLMRFKQICNHPSQALGDKQYLKKDSGKLLRLAELCEEIAARQEKVLIFTQFREMTTPLTEFLTNIFNQPGLRLDGSTPVKQRQSLVTQFQQDNGPPFFVLSLKAAGTGLNLTAASHVIHFDRWWNPAVENQATDRAFRIGQKKNVLVHKFVCRGTIEEKIHAMIAEKTGLADNVLSGNEAALLTELDDAALMDLVSLNLEKTQL